MILEQKLALYYLKINNPEANLYIDAILHILTPTEQKELKAYYKKIKKLPIKPEDLMKIGWKGKELGEIIKELEEEWVKLEFKKNLLIKNDIIKKVIYEPLKRYKPDRQA